MPAFELNVNGRSAKVDVRDPDEPLLYVLRNRLGLTGAKFGCGLGQCGACTVIVDGEAARSCMVYGGEGGREDDRHRRRARHARQASSLAGRADRRASGAMWLLHRGHRDDGGSTPREETRRDGRGRKDGARRQPLPLWIASARAARDRTRRRADSDMSAVFSRRDFLKAGGALVVGFTLRA